MHVQKFLFLIFLKLIFRSRWFQVWTFLLSFSSHYVLFSRAIGAGQPFQSGHPWGRPCFWSFAIFFQNMWNNATIFFTNSMIRFLKTFVLKSWISLQHTGWRIQDQESPSCIYIFQNWTGLLDLCCYGSEFRYCFCNISNQKTIYSGEQAKPPFYQFMM